MVVVDKGGADVLAPVVVVVDKVGSDVVAPGVVLVPTGCVGAVSDARVLLVGGGDASGTAVAVTLAEGAGDDLSAVPSEDESPELHPVAPAIASAPRWNISLVPTVRLNSAIWGSAQAPPSRATAAGSTGSVV